MRVVVMGGTGLIGSKVVEKLIEQGHEARAASPALGVNAVTGEGLTEVLAGADVVVDVTNSPSIEDAAVMEFFSTSTRNLLGAEEAERVGHHVALSVVGSEGLGESGYFRAKIEQERLIKESSIPYSIVRATQFFEFVRSIADAATEGNTVRLAPVLIQPMAADDVATMVAQTSVGSPLKAVTEVGGPEQFRLDELIRRVLAAGNDTRQVITDPTARYFGAELVERSLVPGDNAAAAETTLEMWLAKRAATSAPCPQDGPQPTMEGATP